MNAEISKQKILIVDDVPINIKTLGEALRTNYEIIFAGAVAPFDFGHLWPQPWFGRPSFGIRPIRFSIPNCGCGNLPLYEKVLTIQTQNCYMVVQD